MKSRILRPLLAAGAALALAAAASAQLTFDASIDRTLYGALTEADAGDPTGTFLCGPVSTVNSMIYLQNKYPEIYGTKLIVGSAANTAKELAKLMNTKDPAGTGFGDLLEGKKKWFKDRVGEASTVIEGRTIEGTTPELKLTWRWLYEQIAHGEDVELLVSQDLPGGGSASHYVTLTEFKWTDTDGDGKIDADEKASIGFIDPQDGKWNSYGIHEESAKILIGGFKVDETKDGPVYIWGAAKESPAGVPEPAATGVAAAAALLALGAFARRR